jgi:hypothetical protein
MLNKLVNDRLGGTLVRCAGAVKHQNQPQDMYLKPGMMLMGCTKSTCCIVNGVWYEVVSVDGSQVVVRDSTTEITLTHPEASAWLRLTHAMCYASVQGATLRDKTVLLLDTYHRNFTTRMLIVGASRVTNGYRLRVATPNQERQLLAGAQDIPEPINVLDEPEDEEEQELCDLGYRPSSGMPTGYVLGSILHDDVDYWGRVYDQDLPEEDG